jgi:hypothetical protein
LKLLLQELAHDCWPNRLSAESNVHSPVDLRIKTAQYGESQALLGLSLNLSKFRHLMRLRYSISTHVKVSDTWVAPLPWSLSKAGIPQKSLWDGPFPAQGEASPVGGSFCTCQPSTNVERSLDIHRHLVLVILLVSQWSERLGSEHP